MDFNARRNRFAAPIILLSCCLLGAGCSAFCTHEQTFAPRPRGIKTPVWIPPDVPRELNKVILPVYRIEPPDVLSIDAINIVPKSPYNLRTLDTLVLRVENTLPESPIDGVYPVESGGILQLGPPYGSLKVAGITVDETRVAIEEHLLQYLRDPKVTVSLGEIAGKQQIAGELLVGPDGTITLGSYGSVSVVGKTIAEAKSAIEAHLSELLEDPEVSVAVFSYNSKVYYVITQGAGMGDGVFRFPVMGNETVLDAISQIEGLTEVSSTRIWIARPGRNEAGRQQVLPVDWLGVTQQGDVETNYQILPGDRIYVAEDRLVAFDQYFAKITAPLERIAGFTLLQVGTVTRLSGRVLAGGGSRNSRGGSF